jgi:hypothetical protein
LLLVPRNTAELRVGRLIEIRAAAGYRTADAVDLLFDTLEQVLRKLPTGVAHVTVVDWRCCPLMSPEAAQRIVQRIAATNQNTERSAALVNGDAPVAVLQFLRVIREANLPDRKLFHDQRGLLRYLGEVLTATELERLDAFLSEGLSKLPRAE